MRNPRQNIKQGRLAGKRRRDARKRWKTKETGIGFDEQGNRAHKRGIKRHERPGGDIKGGRKPRF